VPKGDDRPAQLAIGKGASASEEKCMANKGIGPESV
jgi:hypothetical protein